MSVDGAPFCYDATGTVLKCTVTSDRTMRAGVTELSEYARPDRRVYCESEKFRELVLDNVSVSVRECRLTIAERIQRCEHGRCPACVATCNYPLARTVASTLKCLAPSQHLRLLWWLQVSDAGQLARSMHGARRSEGFLAVPERLAAHVFVTGHHNPRGYVQRDSVSCRKERRDSVVAHFAPGFDADGVPVARTGYMVPCRSHADCVACGRHPLTDQLYKCQKRLVLYDTVNITTDNTVQFLNRSTSASAAFDIDLENAHLTGATGVCVDFDSSFNEGCEISAVAIAKDALIGCFDDAVGKFLCGLSLDIRNGDPSTIATSGNLFWPRELIRGGSDNDGDGVADAELLCYNPVDCVQKCLYLERSSRHGAGAPPTCALCNQACPSNVLSTIQQIKTALYDDVFAVVNLVGQCFGSVGIGGCVCQFINSLEPSWRKVSTSSVVRCENGDPFQLLVGQILSLIIDWGEAAINGLIDGVNGIFQSVLPFVNDGPLSRICFNDARRPTKCDGGPLSDAERRIIEECEDETNGGPLETCYYHRVNHICSDTDLLERYNDLFDRGYEDADELQAQFTDAFGQSFATLDPVLADVVEQARISATSGPDLEPRRDICSGAAFASSMRLDMILTSCFFAMVQSR